MSTRVYLIVGRKITAAALSAALILSGSGPSSVAFAQSVINAAPSGAGIQALGAQAGALRLTALHTPLSSSMAHGLLAPSVQNPSEIAPLMSPVSSLSAASALTAQTKLAEPVAAAGVRRDAGNTAGTLTRRSGKRIADAAALPVEASDADAKSYADEAFRRLGAEEDARTSGVVAEPSAAPAASAKTSNWKRSAGLAAAALVAGGVALAPAVPQAADGVSSLPSASSLFAFLGEAGSWIGNGLAFALPVPEIFKAIKAGRVKTPVWRTGVLIAANLALGMVNAAVAGIWLWGLQNTVVAAAMVLIWPAARWSRMIPGTSRTRALWGTVATAAVSLAIGAALYFAAAALVPGALTAWLGAVGVANLLVYVQAAAGAGYILVFAPDILSIVRGKAPDGFTPGFSLLFMLGSLGFLMWGGHLAWIAEAGSADRAKWLINVGLNIVYLLVSGASWWLTRRQARETTSASAKIA
jgi:hypothetical protein